MRSATRIIYLLFLYRLTTVISDTTVLTLVDVYADAEAQAQVQVSQVQVGEVSDVNSNVNSANSPVVVS